MTIPLTSLAAVNGPEIRAGVRERWERIVDDGKFIDGPDMFEFEEKWAAYVGARYCVSVANGTDALELAVRAAYGGIMTPWVSVPALTFAATCEAVVRAGENVMVCDVDDDTLLAPQSAGVGVGLYGQHPGNAAAVLDACQMHGHKTGGRLAAWSFYPTKNLGAWGDAGAVTTDDEGIAEGIRELARHGYMGATGCGFNSRMDTLQAAVLVEKLPYLDEWVLGRRLAAATYRMLLGELGLPLIGDERSVWHLAVTRVKHRKEVFLGMVRQGVACAVHYPLAISQMGWLANYRATPSIGGVRCPRAEKAVSEVLSLPLWPGIEPSTQERVVEALMIAIEEAPSDDND